MAELRLGDVPVIRARLAVPRIGVWHAELLLDTDSAPSGAQELRSDDGAFSYHGTVRSSRAAVWQGRAEVLLVGGADGLSKILPPRYYDDPTLSNVLADLCRETGETLSGACDNATLAATLPKWTRRAGEAGTELAELLRASGASWRVLADGTLWVGPETWPSASVAGDVMEDRPMFATRELATDALSASLVPGSTLGGRRVGYVEHYASADRTRSVVWFDDAPGDPAPGDPAPETPARERIKAALDAVIANATRATRYHALFPGAVLTVHADGTLDVALDAPAFPSITNVPIRPTSPGHTVKPLVGARCLLAFEGGNPGAPVVVGFECDPSKLDRLTLGPVDAAEFTVKGESLNSWLTSLRDKHNDLVTDYKTHEHLYVNTAGTPTPTNPLVTPPLRSALQTFTQNPPGLSSKVKVG